MTKNMPNAQKKTFFSIDVFPYCVASVSMKCVHMYVCLHRDGTNMSGCRCWALYGTIVGESAPLFVDQVRHGVTNPEK